MWLNESTNHGIERKREKMNWKISLQPLDLKSHENKSAASWCDFWRES